MGCISPPGFLASPVGSGKRRNLAGEKRERSPPAFPPPHSLPACRGPTCLPWAPLGCDFSCWMPPPPLSHLDDSRNSQSSFPPASFRCQVLTAPYRCLLLLPVWARGRAVSLPLTLSVPLKKSPFTQCSPKFSGAPIFSGYKVKVHPFSAPSCSARTPPGILHTVRAIGQPAASCLLQLYSHPLSHKNQWNKNPENLYHT